MLNRCLAMMIRGYQKYISPYKGFRCAYAVKHQSLSCSEYARLELLQTGVIHSLSSIRQRLHDCKMAAITLEADKKAQRKTDYLNCCADGLSIPDVSCSSCEMGDTCSVGDACSGADACSCSL
ncbi:membrane protein insertion efficiency factor YidD [Beggiatoa leptomitoformis]|uniref:Membrane protein insertion efficiency factor YidD n=1 Tax=Beggiatoa leptomitoformis TaxID=288004 RepID=A0A2N9YEU8_9GAMM|nr:membrane protein insertion efficiency factor YidD [Beggiatoa leptomitoformis]AUI69000.1 membrane protein insertion efficiency factor YidD [Beggiatoa leptomitoformis]QGX03768.1 membrane protein insertion efficiency factor YidD [Beggiatoa leptomitoformis]